MIRSVKRNYYAQADLTVTVALQKARAVEVVTQEAKAMQEPSQATTGQEEDMHKLSIHLKCYRCGKQGHSSVECKYKKAKCRLCQKVGHLARVCQTAGSISAFHKDAGTKASRPTQKRGSVQALQVDDASDSSSEDHLHSIFQLGRNPIST